MPDSANREPEGFAAGLSAAAPPGLLVVPTIGVVAIAGQAISVGAIEVPGITSETIHAPAVQVPSVDAPRAEVDAIEVAECVVEPVRSTEIQAAHRPEISRWRRPLRKNERISSVFSLPILLGKLRSLWWWWAVMLIVSLSPARPGGACHAAECGGRLTMDEPAGSGGAWAADLSVA